MATYTDNYHLEKPAQSDLYNIDVFNGNADIIDAALASKALAQNQATIESTNSASRNYAKGEFLVYNGLLYKVTAAISSGGTIAPGTNCVATNTGTELKALNDSLTIRTFPYSQVFTPASGWTLSSSSNVHYNKAGLVEIELLFTASPVAQTGGRYTLGTFNMCAPLHDLSIQSPIAAVNNSNLIGSVPTLIGPSIAIDNFTGGNVANVRVHAIYFSTNLPS